MAELNLREAAFRWLERLHGTLEKAIQPMDSLTAQQWLKTLQVQFDRFTINNDALMSRAEKGELIEHIALTEKAITMYNACFVALSRMVEQAGRDARPLSSVEMKLDPLAIPEFDGALHNWLAFKDVFETLVHNVSYPDAYKLGKLRAAVKGNAVPLVGGIYSGGYQEVWTALKLRYDNQKLLAETHVTRFLNINPVQEESQKSLFAVIDAVEESLRALKVMNLPVQHWDALTVPIVKSKLPAVTQRTWCMTCSATELPSLQALLQFLAQRAQKLASDCGKGAKKMDAHSRGNVVRSHTANTIPESHCTFCNGSHRTSRCPDLLAFNSAQRFAAVKAKHLCHNCLKSGHYANRCPSGNCRNCGRKHNTILCQNDAPVASVPATTPAPEVASTTALVSISSSSEPEWSPGNNPRTFMAVNQSTVLLATARALVFDEHGESRVARILCDPGSQASFITDRLANLLRLPKRKHNLMVEGIGEFPHTRSSSSVSVSVKSLQTGDNFKLNALVIPTITRVTPSFNVNMQQWPHLAGLSLADPQFGTPGGIDMLLGADVWGLIVEGSISHGSQNEPHAQCTRLGWVVFGPASTAAASETIPMAFSAQLSKEELMDELLENLWKIGGLSDDSLEDNDNECVRLFSTTYSRRDDGRYIVHIPLSRPSDELGGSYIQALRQLESLERRLAGNDQLRSRYIQFMREYASLGHMTKVPDLGDKKNYYYIPHHAVINKFRVVFNASARTTNGLSLNDIQHVGPTIQDSIVNIILRFRRYQFAITADIEKMFRQVLVTPEQRDLQRILWRESPSEPLTAHRLNTITYGMASRPYNAVRTLHQCALDNFHLVENHDAALNARDSILSNFYVDDWLTSCSSELDAVSLSQNVDKILKGGQLTLRKWNSNAASVLRRLAPDTLAEDDHTIGAPTSVLGIIWQPSTDQLLFRINLADSPDTVTKRHVLSEIARLFDPTGILSPVVVRGRIFMQTLWSANLTWDEPLPPELESDWKSLKGSLHALERLRVPRWLGMIDGYNSELYGFCDASSRAYAAAVYVRTEVDGEVNVMLMAAATKVAPLKGATIPRLELCAAQLLSTLLSSTKRAIGMSDISYHLFTDSQVVLCWIRKELALLKPYVANRVKTILTHTTPHAWQHIRSSLNPADCASRGISAAELADHPLWWHGPPWLREKQVQRDELATLTPEQERQMLDEVKPSIVVAVAQLEDYLTTRTKTGQIIPLLERFSSLQRILRVMAYVVRWLPRNRSPRSGIIDAREMDAALTQLIRLEQRRYFAIEINCLLASSSLPSGSALLPLNPFVGTDGLLRVGGRIGYSALPVDRRFPIILARSSRLALHLIAKAHRDTLHGGTQLMLQVLRSRFWILRARQTVRSYVQSCVLCRRHRGSVLTQQMADLPWQRVNAFRPFQMTGVDYCGPFTLRIGHKRSKATAKAYVVIFVCMATKAVHIEVAEDLSATAFLDVFSRFISRRGPCSDLYSDNGTAFVGANGIMQRDLAAWHSEYTQKAISNLGVSWHFITPSAPHQGGIWEAAVKSAKYHLVRIVGGQSMWYGQLLTLTARIEACLNSRPIVPLHDDPDDRFALTPGDFLIGAPLLSTPEPSITDLPANRVKHWQWLRRLHQDFWDGWHEDYLTTLQTRSKWRTRSRNLQANDIVLIKGENLPPSYWRLGRVVAVHPGSDGLVRNATIKTASGHLTRPVQKLCLLLDSKDFEPSSSTGQDV